MVNVLWVWFNLIAAHLLIFGVGAFDLRSPADVGPAALGAFLPSMALARSFGRFNDCEADMGTGPSAPSQFDSTQC